MPEHTLSFTLNELRDRIKAARVPIPESSLELIRPLLDDALAPLRAADESALRSVEPAAVFDADVVTRGETDGRDELCYATIREIGELFRRKQLSPVELTTETLGRIERVDPALNAFVTLTRERALADAKAAEAEFLRVEHPNPLLGIPIAYKDMFATKGIVTTAGSALLADWTPDMDAACVTRLQEAGAVMLGKLTTFEFAFGIQLPGHRFPPARNPWNPAHVPGGSSSGSGAASAAGLAFGALGTDTGGSIRGPAALCGIAGLKPTYGLLSRSGVVPLSWTLDHVGPMARTVEDCAYLLQALACYDPADPVSHPVPVSDYLGVLGCRIDGLRVGVPREYFFEGIDPEVTAAFEEALATLRRLGAVVKDVAIPSIHVTPTYILILLSEAYAYHERNLRERPEMYGDVLRDQFLAGGLVTAAEYNQAQRLRSQLRDDMAAALGSVDVLVTPAATRPAATMAAVLGSSAGIPPSNRAPFNLTGLPALAIPCGFSRDGLPLSLHIAGRAFDEATVLRVGHAFEQATEWHRRRPPV